MSLGLLLEQGTYIPDLRSDTSTQTYVGPDHGLNDIYYTPSFLISIPTHQSLLPTESIQLRIDALQSLVRMSNAIYNDLGLPLIVISAYRSHNYQQNLINQFGDGNLRALPGHSEHQLGLAIDIMGLSNAHMEGDGDASRIYQRLVGHGHEYGRHNSYQNGLTVDGYYVEKRHRRYLGVPFATLLKTKNQTLTQYFYQMIRPIDTHGYIHTNPTHIFQSRITPTPIYRPSQPDTTPPRDNPSNESVDRSNELFTKPL